MRVIQKGLLQRHAGLTTWLGAVLMLAGLHAGGANDAWAAKPKAKPAKKAPAEPAADSAPAAETGGASSERTEPAPEPAPARDAADTGASTPASEEDLRLGPFAPPPKPFPFPLLGDERAKELFVDRDGTIYRERKYSGHVPDWNEVSPGPAAGGRCKVEPQDLSWVGFQNNADGSRIYVQVDKAACGYVYRPDDTHIVIDLPQVSIPTSNLRREILTGAFPTSVAQVRAEDVAGRGTRVVISLKDSRPYLSAQQGRYIFVDVTR